MIRIVNGRAAIALALIAILCLCTNDVMAKGVILDSRLQAAIAYGKPDEEIAVIVTLKDGVNLDSFTEPNTNLRRAQMVGALKAHAEMTHGPLINLMENLGASKTKSLWIINGIEVIARPDVIRELTKHPEVESIKLDYTIYAPVVSLGSAPSSAEWNIDAIHAPDLWAMGYRGKGVVVANMDTGVDPDHPDLMSKWRGGKNSWFDPWGEHASPYDANGHGTQTMGIMVGGSASGAAIGVAPEAKWIAVKIYNDSGITSPSKIHEGFQWLLNPDGQPLTNDAPVVVNNSWGLDDAPNKCVTDYETDIKVLKKAGISVVCAAGNDGPFPSSSVSPANYPESLAAGAVDDTIAVAYFSSRGPSACNGAVFPTAVAPGVNIKTSGLTYGGIIPNSYKYVSGTSYSSPHLAGALALLRSIAPHATGSEVESALKQSCVDLGAKGPDNASGYGLIDLMAAYANLPHTVRGRQ